MEKTKRERLQKAGWSVGSAQDFLDLSDEETALIEMQLALARSLRDRREAQDLSQSALARRAGWPGLDQDGKPRRARTGLTLL